MHFTNDSYHRAYIPRDQKQLYQKPIGTNQYIFTIKFWQQWHITIERKDIRTWPYNHRYIACQPTRMFSRASDELQKSILPFCVYDNAHHIFIFCQRFGTIRHTARVTRLPWIRCYSWYILWFIVITTLWRTAILKGSLDYVMKCHYSEEVTSLASRTPFR